MMKNLLLACALALSCALAGYAQGDASIAGVIQDQNGGVLPEALVSLENVETGVLRTTLTNQVGFYSFPGLTAARYQVAATFTDFKSGLSVEFPLTVGQERRIDLMNRDYTGYCPSLRHNPPPLPDAVEREPAIEQRDSISKQGTPFAAMLYPACGRSG